MWLAEWPLQGRLVFIDTAHQNSETRACRPHGYSCRSHETVRRDTHTHTHTHTHSHKRHIRSFLFTLLEKQLNSEEINRRTSKHKPWGVVIKWGAQRVSANRHTSPLKNIKLPLILRIHAHVNRAFRGYLKPGNHTHTHTKHYSVGGCTVCWVQTQNVINWIKLLCKHLQ